MPLNDNDDVVPPQVDELNDGSSITLYSGSPVSVECQSYGWPTPTITWTRLDENADPSGLKPPNMTAAAEELAALLGERTKVNGSLLTIDSVDYSDRKAYHCFASNELGFSRSSVILRIKG